MNMRASIAAARASGPLAEPGDARTFEFRFAATDPVFAGHFPNRPILPGIFQLEMARMAAEWSLKCKLSIREVSKAKFQRPILPDETVRLQLKLTEADGSWQARAGFSVDGRPAGETLLCLCANT
jgi:3-hydroxymyristoyl/3-hydroxydecanoyl-(acyl carrier protein) dehydratase